ncbi:MAG: flagellar basal body rod C-terminal domain-containing protein [Candidatus Margulisbacteria bacterium]|nr:flagellar basal body rod C-terminal domain-containing protein [Candidatus Margulisiibacteriota bacterium]
MRFIVTILIMMFVIVFAGDGTIDIANSGMDFLEKQNGIIMENMVNLKTPGYREVKITSVSNPRDKTVLYSYSHVFNPGPFINSGKNLDFALEDKGFFMVRDNLGKILFTRDGRFEINENRQLVTVSGKFIVLDINRASISIPEYKTVKADNKGNLYDSDNNQIGQLGVFDVDDYKLLKSVNHVFFYIDDSMSGAVHDADSYNVKQGFYENSNVDYSRLMIKLSDTNKYNANTQLIQTRMKMLDTAIEIVNKN